VPPPLNCRPVVGNESVAARVMEGRVAVEPITPATQRPAIPFNGLLLASTHPVQRCSLHATTKGLAPGGASSVSFFLQPNLMHNNQPSFSSRLGRLVPSCGFPTSWLPMFFAHHGHHTHADTATHVNTLTQHMPFHRACVKLVTMLMHDSMLVIR